MCQPPGKPGWGARWRSALRLCCSSRAALGLYRPDPVVLCLAEKLSRRLLLVLVRVRVRLIVERDCALSVRHALELDVYHSAARPRVARHNHRAGDRPADLALRRDLLLEQRQLLVEDAVVLVDHVVQLHHAAAKR